MPFGHNDNKLPKFVTPFPYEVLRLTALAPFAESSGQCLPPGRRAKMPTRCYFLGQLR
jgi:hypothetical protein